MGRAMTIALQRESDILSRTWAELLKAGPERIWGLCDETQRLLWLQFARLDGNKFSYPWKQLSDEQRRRLTLQLTLMATFFIDLDRARRAVNS